MKRTLLLALMVGAALLVSGCSQSPQTTPSPPPKPTAAPSTPAPPAAAPPTGDIARGQQVFEGKTGVSPACTTCHSTGRDRQKIVGPPLFGVADISQEAIQRKIVPLPTVEAYIQDSIENPSSFVVPGFPDNIMPKDYKQKLGAQDTADLVTYLASLKGLTKAEVDKELAPPAP